MEKHNKDPRRAHPKLTECERASLAHVDPDVNLEKEEFYFRHRGECPTMDEYSNKESKARRQGGAQHGDEGSTNREDDDAEQRTHLVPQ